MNSLVSRRARLRARGGLWLLARALGLAALLGAGLSALLPALAGAASPNPGVVRAVLFYSPTCPHCHQVMTEDLPSLQQRYGEQLDLRMLDVTTSLGSGLYDAAVSTFAIPDERVGVPTLIVGDVVLVGSAEIPERFPLLVEQLLAAGGSNWPGVPGLTDAIADPGNASGSGGPGTGTSPLAAALDRAAGDPVGSGAALAVLVCLAGALAWSASLIWRASGAIPRSVPPSGLIPWIVFLGLMVAGYLTLVETSGGTAVCGPIGDCNRVHQSEFARLLGVVPIAVLGLLGYLAILATWIVGRIGRGVLVPKARLMGMALALAGTAFSIYLTFLEPFVIGATCAWCLVSAVLMGALLVLSTPRTLAATRAPAVELAPATSGPGRGA